MHSALSAAYKFDDTIIKVDESLCIGCSNCIRTCPGGLITKAATIAMAYIQLAAHALGLGSSWSGGINTAAQAYPPLAEMLGLPEGIVSYGTILLGQSAETFGRIPVRKPQDVTWR